MSVRNSIIDLDEMQIYSYQKGGGLVSSQALLETHLYHKTELTDI